MTDKQQLAIDAVRRGESISLIGPAGTGKSYTINQVITDHTVITAPTSVAARNIDGVTAHSAFSLSHGMQTDKDLSRITPDMYSLFGKSSCTDMLVIDEAFNFRADMLDAINHKLKIIRGDGSPFGGLQTLLAGDCLQNSPIVDVKEARYFRRKYRSEFIFNSKVWEELDPSVFVLDKVYRNTNQDQLKHLHAIRKKDPTGSDNGKPKWMSAIDYVNSIAEIRDYNPDADLYLATYKKDVEKINLKEYKKIKSPEFTYKGEIVGSFKKSSMDVPEELKLKVGARVMFCINNKNVGYFNGLQGVVTYLSEDTIIVDTEEGELVVEPHIFEEVKLSMFKGKLTKTVVGTYKQFPLIMSWAATINKVQGITLDNMVLDLGKVAFGEGQLYVALSRLTDLKGLTLVREIEYKDLNVSKKALEFIKDNE